ncbi:MAG: ArsR family transcriptional regulator [Balneolaceae bacterium]|nr:ArsR family transcriptional regulator [Balneolaceae bacterium]
MMCALKSSTCSAIEEHLCPCDLSDILDMSVPAVSQHLRKLKDGGLVDNRAETGKPFFIRSMPPSTKFFLLILNTLKTIIF